MKKRKRFLSLLLFCLFSCFLFQVHAEESGFDEIAMRLAKANQLGLNEWIDDDGYLMDSFYEGKSDQELSEMGIDGLVNTLSVEELDAYVKRLNSGIGLYTVTRYEKVSQINPSTGNYLYTGIFEVDGRLAYCIERSVATPAKGSSTGSWGAVTNTNLRKVLYYGYNGPAAKGYTYVETALAAGEANGDGDNALGRSVLAEIKAYATPPSTFKVWKVETNGGKTQDLAFYTIEENGYVQLKKISDHTEITSGNDNYSLAGAVYGVYSNSTCTKEVGRLTTNAAGTSGTLQLSPGTYYVKEIAAPQGYLLSTKVQSITVASSKTTTVTMSDSPQTIVPEVFIQKKDAETGEMSPQEGYTFEGAQFLVEFYGRDYDEGIDPAMKGDVPDKQWMFTTDAEGTVCLHPDYLMSGDFFWTNAAGQYVLPLGTLTVQEIRAPEGYQINPQIFVEKLEVGENTFSTVFVPETSVEFELVIQKVNETGKQLSNAEFAIYLDEACTKEVKRGVTAADGTLTITGLKPKTYYYVRETKPPEGYELDLKLNTIYSESLEKNQTIYLKITNKTAARLPDTGTIGNSMLILLGGCSCFVAIMEKKRRKL